jgi:two-component system response regulator AdeR
VRDDPSGERAVGIRSALRASGRSMERPGDIAQNGHHPRVLLVDDDDELADVLRQALRESGYAVATVRHGAAALDLIGQIQPDVILLDLTMPIMDGWSFVDQYRRGGNANGRIVLVTGHPNAREISLSLGADAYVGKPFELTELLRTLEQQLGAIG